jgi:ribosomal protein S18 acetylase RimI-like enzyme
MNIKIKALHVNDIPDFIEMNNELNDVDCGTVESMTEALQQNKNELIYIAMLDNKAAGFICGQVYSSICYTSKQGEMTELYVREEYRRLGIATMLVKHLEHELLNNNVHEITIITGVKNIKAQNLYNKYGYSHKRFALIKSFY